MSDNLDVVIVGAGLSGIGSAVHLQRNLPGKRYAILEAREAIGGTWDLFRYPGVRSDSDMYTLGYSFKPWDSSRSLADGEAIREYVRETAREYGIERNIRFGHRVVRADWDSATARWRVVCERAGGETVELTARFVHWCSGYYRYEAGYTPEFEGVEQFTGEVIHPQHWPEGFDYSGKRVVVIGSGATAVTLVPAMAGTAAHVTMLQRSPSYVMTLPGVDVLADKLRSLLPRREAYRVSRVKNVGLASILFQASRRRPELVKRLIRAGVKRQLPADFEVEKHFTPQYNPWDQRMCFVPDGDLFRAIREGQAEIVTDRIKRFTPDGILLESGRELAADVIVTATGLQMQMLGGAQLRVDGRDLDVSQTVAYKGMMFSGIPNMALSVGYTNASWTLKCDLICEYVCRLLAHMDARGYDYCVPVPPPAGEELLPLIDLGSGYVLRSIDQLPKQGSRLPWRLHQNWFKDMRMFRRAPLEDEGVRFGRAGDASPVGDTSELVAA